MEENQGTPKMLSKKSQGAPRLVDTYAVQCEECLKWRVIDTQEEYEEIRSKVMEDPYVCSKKSGVTCEDPADIDYNASGTWVIDKPGIPKTPKGFKRSLVLRRDYSKMDAYYITPTGKKLRTRSEIASFLEANPKYKEISISNFNFTVPKVHTFSFSIPMTTLGNYLYALPKKPICPCWPMKLNLQGPEIVSQNRTLAMLWTFQFVQQSNPQILVQQGNATLEHFVNLVLAMV